jgi:hypothetical protein
MKPNLVYTFLWTSVIAIGFFEMSYNFANFNAFTKILYDEYDYDDKMVLPNEDLFNSLVSGLIPGGGIIGAAIGGYLALLGRRNAIIILAFACTIGSLLTMIYS